MKAKFVNWEVATYALFLVGGVSRPIYTEDVALKCFELAPESFSWIHHPQYPDKDIVRVSLVDARKAKTGSLVVGRAGTGVRRVPQSNGLPSADGWMLTESGVKWVLGNEQRLASALNQKATNFGRQEILHKLQRVRDHRLFGLFSHSPAMFEPSIGELADLLRCRVDAGQTVWTKRIDLLRNQATITQQNEVMAFVDSCDKRLRQLLFIPE